MFRIDEMVEQIRQLNFSDKKQLLQFLLQETGGVERDADEAWSDEVVQRVKAIRSGAAAIEPYQD